MTEIDIPFNGWSRRRLNAGRKFCTSRTKKYGEVGDTFKMGGQLYEIIKIEPFRYDVIIESFYIKEGADSPGELRGVFKQIFRGKEPEADREFYVHFFEPLNPVEDER